MEPSGAPWRALEAAEPATADAEPTPRATPWVAIGAVAIAVAVGAAAFLMVTRADPVIDVEGGIAVSQPVGRRRRASRVAGGRGRAGRRDRRRRQ